MINRICGKCGTRKVADAGSYGGSSFFKCETCGQLGMSEKFPEMTVFHQITASPEVLAEKLVYYTNVRKKKPLYDWKRRQIADRWFLCGIWKSSVTNETYSTKSEAIAATVAKLNKVEK